MKRIPKFVALVAILLGLATTLNAQVAGVSTIGSPQDANNYTYSFNGVVGSNGGIVSLLGMPFQTGPQTYTLTSISAYLQNTGGNPAMSDGRLYVAAADATWAPMGTVLTAFSSASPTPGGSFASSTFTPLVPNFTLSANTRYVFVLMGANPQAASSFSWGGTTTAPTLATGWSMPNVITTSTAGPPLYGPPLSTNMSTLTWSQGGNNDYLMGQVTVAGAIPEPSTYAALFGVAALGFAAWRRRRQA